MRQLRKNRLNLFLGLIGAFFVGKRCDEFHEKTSSSRACVGLNFFFHIPSSRGDILHIYFNRKESAPTRNRFFRTLGGLLIKFVQRHIPIQVFGPFGHNADQLTIVMHFNL